MNDRLTVKETERLYYADSHMFEFTATITECVETDKGNAFTLNRTAFFPEGGGQRADTGYGTAPDGSKLRVMDVREKDGKILHYCDNMPVAGEEYYFTLDAEQRMRRMQNHSGEHIVSGTANRLYGCENVGFHMGDEFMTIDFDRELTPEELTRIEYEANLAIRENIEVHAWFPDPEELANTNYRSKLELTENVRLVEIPGVDICACCAPHVYRTGEVGIIKILDCMRHRGGVRLSLVCGMDALEDYIRLNNATAAISGLLSAKRGNTAQAVERIKSEKEELSLRLAQTNMKYINMLSRQYAPCDGNICVFEEAMDETALRELTNLLMKKCRLAAVFFPAGDGYRYIIGSEKIDMKTNARAINAGINGRGGGKGSMIQGSCAADESKIREFISQFEGI